MKKKNGFTLIEIMLSITLIAILSYAFVSYLNPGQQLAQARNSQRSLHLNALINSIRQNIADGRGAFSCGIGDIPTTAKKMAIGAGNYDIASCISPIYIAGLPFDPVDSNAHFTSNADYDTGYTIIKASATGLITLSAPSAELGIIISVTR